MLDYVLGIVKAYTTRVGTGPFPTELTDDIGARLAKRGNEFGSVTGRPRRCGWLDIPALKRSLQLNGVDGLVHHQARRARRHAARSGSAPATRVDGKPLDAAAVGRRRRRRMHAGVRGRCPGWRESTVGVKRFDALPRQRARVPATHRGADRGADRDGLDRPRARRDDPDASSVPLTRRSRMTMSLHVSWDAIQHAGRAPRAAGARIRLALQPDHLHRARRACASATCCRASTSMPLAILSTHSYTAEGGTMRGQAASSPST